MKTSVIIISGVAGSGKSTLAERLSHELGLHCVHSSGIFRQLQEQQKKLDAHQTRQGKGYWESDAGLKYYDKRLDDFSLDQKVDEELLRAVKNGNVVLDSWVMPWLAKDGLKIWLNVSEEERIRRLAGRDKMKPEEVARRVKTKEEKTAEIYKKMYGFDFGKDLSPFHIVINTDSLNAEEVFQAVSCLIKPFLKKK